MTMYLIRGYWFYSLEAAEKFFASKNEEAK